MVRYSISDDEDYRDFMINLLLLIEPRAIKPNEVVFDELEQINEINFLMSGYVNVGFKINNKPKMVVRAKQGNIIGGYETVFNKRSCFIYKALTPGEAFMIRKMNYAQL